MQDYEQSPQYPNQPGQPIPPPRQPTRQVSGSLLLVLLGLILLLILPHLAEQVQEAMTRGRLRAEMEAAGDALAKLPDAPNRYRLAAMRISPSVVGIKTVQLVSRPGFGDEWWGQQPFRAEAGEGSGVIVDEAGYIVTNYHVISHASKASVQLADGRTIENVKVVGADPHNDLAVLKIDAGKLPAAPWGDSNQLEVGDFVLAVGNPYGLERTVTAGIVSAKDREGTTALGPQEFLQTDAAVNPGNSGGPLVNLKGEVVGINTAIYGRAYQGISFAIPSEKAKEVYERLKTGQKVVRGWLGVQMSELNASLARELGLQQVQGVVVVSVVPDSPAEKAGIQARDVIVQWNGRRIDDPVELSRLVGRAKVGSTVKLQVIRDGQPLDLTVEIGERPTFAE
jgi:serine protease Do